MSTVENLKKTLEKYDFNLKKEQEQFENGIYYFGITDALIYFDPKKDQLGISFVVFAKPESVANTTLILSQVKGVKEVEVMDSFIMTSDNKLLQGDEAYSYYTKSYMKYVENKYQIDKAQTDLLKTIDEKKFGRC